MYRKFILAMFLAVACVGCATSRTEPPTKQPRPSIHHPIASRVQGDVFLYDGKMLTGTIIWKPMSREYVITQGSKQWTIPADTVERIEVKKDIEPHP